MPNTPDNKTFIDLALKTLKEREVELVGYQTLNGYIDEIATLVGTYTSKSRQTIKASFGKANFLGLELTGIVPDQEKLQAKIKLLRVNPVDSDKTPARVMISMDLYPAGQTKTNKEQPLGSLNYTLGNKLLIENNRIYRDARRSKTTPSDFEFDKDLLNIRLAIDTANKMLQGPSL